MKFGIDDGDFACMWRVWLVSHKEPQECYIRIDLINQSILRNFYVRVRYYPDPVFSFFLYQDSLGPIKRVQNNCIRFMFGIKKFEHVSHKLVESSWLSMRLRINYYGLCTLHKIVGKKRPSYLFNKLQ